MQSPPPTTTNATDGTSPTTDTPASSPATPALSAPPPRGRREPGALEELRVCSRVLPDVPYAAHSVDGLRDIVGSSAVRPTHARVLGLLCTKRPAATATASSSAPPPPSPTALGRRRPRAEAEGAHTGAVAEEPQPPHKAPRTVYVRMQFSRALIATLPLELVRAQYPQILIDYLLSTAVWK